MDQQAELCETYQLKWAFYSSYMHSCIATSLYNDSYADVALVTMDGHQVMAHRYVLSYGSRYLAQVLKFQRKVTTTLPLMIVMPPEIDYKSLKVLLRYMYSGEAKVPKEILKNVLRGGDILQIKGLYREKEDAEKGIKQTQPPLSSPSPLNPTPTSTPATTPTPISSTPPPLVTASVPPPLIPTSTPKIVKKQTPATTTTASITNTVNVVNSPTAKTVQKLTPTFLLVHKPTEQQTYGSATRSKPQVLNFTLLPSVQKDDAGKNTKSGEEGTNENSDKLGVKSEPSIRDSNLQYLMIKDEPVDWSEADMEVLESQDVYEDIQLKSEQEEEGTDSGGEEEEEKMFSPLTCELCTETFTIPREWVRHVQTHTDMLPAKRRRRDSTGANESYENDSFPELMCDLCQKPFQTPAEWVKHIQSTHTEFELHLSNKQNVSERPSKNYKKWDTTTSPSDPGKYCNHCKKSFPSNASMLIHKRSHTGEKPFSCEYCSKTFNVKSNLLRHLRTIHNKIINSGEVDNREEKNE